MIIGRHCWQGGFSITHCSVCVRNSVSTVFSRLLMQQQHKPKFPSRSFFIFHRHRCDRLSKHQAVRWKASEPTSALASSAAATGETVVWQWWWWRPGLCGVRFHPPRSINTQMYSSPGAAGGQTCETWTLSPGSPPWSIPPCDS